MDVRQKLVELSDIQVLQREMECVERKSATNCTDCLNCDLLMTDERILTAYKNAIDALQNAHGVTVQGWISVKDRLPEDNGKLQAFLVCRNQPSSTSGKVLIETEFFTNDFSGNNNVTHWMPMPQPPKGE